MSQDLKSRLETWVDRGVPVGPLTLLERVEQDLADLEATPAMANVATAPRRPAWAIVAIAIAMVAIAVGFVPWLFRSSDQSPATPGPTSSVPVATTLPPQTTSLPSTTVPATAPTTAPTTTTSTSVAPPPEPVDPVTVPNLQDRDGPPSVETFKSFFGLELDYIIKYVDETPPAEDAEIAYQDPPPGATVEAGSVVTVYLFSGVQQGHIDAPGRPLSGTWTTYLPADGLASDCVAA
ncbi:MAG: PASTA domain-containing protein, partial [Acidimicrobiia bacterium]|nr:PASTA domain-containing protein [Acidimicrobiia bacterium]